MLSYRHVVHAGNFADVHKHSVLCTLLERLRRTASPCCYLDSHAAAGRYDLTSAVAQKSGAYRQGILRLWQQQSDLPDALLPYLAAVRAFNPGEHAAAPRYYPGSPQLIRHFLRPEDRMVLTELHPADFQALQREFAADRQVAVYHLDGYQGLKDFLPPKERHGLVLIDPDFKRRDEPEHMLAGIETAYQRWAKGIFALWLPVTHRSTLARFYRKLGKSAIPKILSCEMCIRPPRTSQQLNGSCLVIINAPWQVDNTLEALQAYLSSVLADESQASHCVTWLRGE